MEGREKPEKGEKSGFLVFIDETQEEIANRMEELVSQVEGKESLSDEEFDGIEKIRKALIDSLEMLIGIERHKTGRPPSGTGLKELKRVEGRGGEEASKEE